MKRCAWTLSEIARSCPFIPRLDVRSGPAMSVQGRLRTIITVLRHYMVLTPELADEAIARLVSWRDQKGIRV